MATAGESSAPGANTSVTSSSETMSVSAVSGSSGGEESSSEVGVGAHVGENGSVAFDLESYIARYPPKSDFRLHRLLYIAETCRNTQVSQQALRLAKDQMKESQNTLLYRQVLKNTTTTKTGNFGANNNNNAPTNENSNEQQTNKQDNNAAFGTSAEREWLSTTEAHLAVVKETLEGRLSTAQVQLQKEAIRTAYLAMADFYRQHGDTHGALRFTIRSLDYCTNRRQTSQVCLLIMELALLNRNYEQVLDYVSKAEHSSSSGLAGARSSAGSGSGGGNNSATDSSFSTKLKIASGLAHLALGRFHQAALQLTSVEIPKSSNFFAFCAPQDVALYGSLCGLATLKRPQLVQQLLDQTEESLLDWVPSLRQVMEVYCHHSDYPKVLEMLHQLKTSSCWHLDMMLGPHLDNLLHKVILEKCCTEYLQPYSRVSLQGMATKFNMPLEKLFAILEALIGRGHVPYAKINCRTWTLERQTTGSGSNRMTGRLREQQWETYNRIVHLERNILNDVYASTVRIACMENDIAVADRRSRRLYAAGGIERSSSSDDDEYHGMATNPMGGGRGNSGWGEPMDLGNPEDAY